MALGIMFNFQTQVVAGITALAGGGQTGATPLLAMFNSVDTVATAADSVMLPTATPGNFVFVLNNQASNSLQVFGQPASGSPGVAGAGDTIAPISSSTYAATGTGVSQAASVLTYYICFTPGKWKQGAVT